MNQISMHLVSENEIPLKKTTIYALQQIQTLQKIFVAGKTENSHTYERKKCVDKLGRHWVITPDLTTTPHRLMCCFGLSMAYFYSSQNWIFDVSICARSVRRFCIKRSVLFALATLLPSTLYHSQKLHWRVAYPPCCLPMLPHRCCMNPTKPNCIGVWLGRNGTEMESHEQPTLGWVVW